MPLPMAKVPPIKKLTHDDIEKVLFGNLKRNKERDTQTEMLLFRTIRSFINDPKPDIKRKTATALTMLNALKKHYPNDLIPKAKVVYRGTKVNYNTYEKLKLDPTLSRRKWVTLLHTYQPMSKIQSWSTKKKIAEFFAEKISSSPNDFPAILMVIVDDSFIMTSKLMNLIANATSIGSEYEILRLGNKPIRVAIQVKKEWLHDYTQ